MYAYVLNFVIYAFQTKISPDIKLYKSYNYKLYKSYNYITFRKF